MLDKLPNEILSNIVLAALYSCTDVSDPPLPTFPQDRIICINPAAMIQPLSLTNYKLRQICIPKLFENVQLNFLDIDSDEYRPTHDDISNVYNVLDRFNDLLKSRPLSIVRSIRYVSRGFFILLVDMFIDG